MASDLHEHPSAGGDPAGAGGARGVGDVVVPDWVRAIHAEQDRATAVALLASTVPGLEGVAEVDDLAGVAPGVALAAVLDTTDLGGVSDAGLVEVVAAWQRMSAWVHAHTTRAAAALAGRASMNPTWSPAAGGPPARAGVAGDELAMRLACSRRTATRLVEHGQAYAGVLSATGDALATGRITAVVADKIADRLSDQPIAVALAAEDRVLTSAGQRTPTQIDRDLEKALLVVDPHEATHRIERARTRRCVHRPRVLPDGMASLTAILPAATAARIEATLENAARTARSAGDPRTLDQLRADGLTDLILHTTCTTPSTAPRAQQDVTASTSGLQTRVPDSWGTNATAPTLHATGTVHAPGTVHDADDLDGRGPAARTDATHPDDDTHNTATNRLADDADTPTGNDTSVDTDAPTTARTVCGNAPHHRTEIRITVALTTLLGLDEHPGDLTGIGPIDATTARDLALAAGGVWRRIITDPLSGTVLDVGRTTYRPPRALARHVHVRDQTCARPGCTTPAETCDLDHTTEYHHPPDGQPPGTTADHNLGPLCRRDHRLKTDGGSTLRQTAPGTYLWTTPTGHHYATTPGDHGRHQHLGTTPPPGSTSTDAAPPPAPFPTAPF
jgi:hypothetical protein